MVSNFFNKLKTVNCFVIFFSEKRVIDFTFIFKEPFIDYTDFPPKKVKVMA